MKKIIILASGSGTNAERIISYFDQKQTAEVSLILTNNPQAGVLQRAKRLQIPSLVFDQMAFYQTDIVLNIIQNLQPDLIVLAGFLWKFPENILNHYQGGIVNIHPALLPKFGGKGMYGMHVHQKVIEQKETQSGITIHHVNENYDEGAIIFQAKTQVSEQDTPETLAEKIHQLEYEHFPKVIEELLGL
ncbi:phosphoribosylglycinamide formyltransferase [Capnocytophaga canimorsus]|uniref:phosphoribosylglycinamide formyltransferase n=1 Tax=Capnocytophaga canimorsus TaxID=28188 RepID=UPI001AC7D80D|nr:phosphoribosylglycinamide formyltransferase [Capnocytophaga canimorsus]GIM57548.1 phosphoribosylglycinamide formyltransferase [Capnocytophaga canimorsus]